MEISNNSNNPLLVSKLSNKNSKKKQRQRQYRGRTGRRTKEMVEIAKERIRILMKLAEDGSIKRGNETRSRRYVQLARNLSTRYNVRMEEKFRHRFCRSCNSFFGVSNTTQVRNRNGKIVITCKYCGRVKRLPINKKMLR